MIDATILLNRQTHTHKKYKKWTAQSGGIETARWDLGLWCSTKKKKKEISQRRHIVSSSIEPFMFGSNKYCACYLQLLFFKFSYLSDLRWWEWNDAMTEWCRKHLASLIHECMVGEIWERQLSWLATMQAGNKPNQKASNGNLLQVKAPWHSVQRDASVQRVVHDDGLYGDGPQTQKATSGADIWTEHDAQMGYT